MLAYRNYFVLFLFLPMALRNLLLFLCAVCALGREPEADCGRALPQWCRLGRLCRSMFWPSGVYGRCSVVRISRETQRLESSFLLLQTSATSLSLSLSPPPRLFAAYAQVHTTDNGHILYPEVDTMEVSNNLLDVLRASNITCFVWLIRFYALSEL